MDKASGPDDRFTFGIERVQKWTLGAIVTAAVGLGIWIGTITTKIDAMNSKIDNIEKSTDSNAEALTAARIQLGSLQQAVGDLKSSGAGPHDGEGGRGQPSPVEFKIPPVTVNIPEVKFGTLPVQVQSASAPVPQKSVLDEFLEYQILKDLKNGESGDQQQHPPNSSTPRGALTPEQVAEQDKQKYVLQQESILMDQIKQANLDDLANMEKQVTSDKKLSDATKAQLGL